MAYVSDVEEIFYTPSCTCYKSIIYPIAPRHDHLLGLLKFNSSGGEGAILKKRFLKCGGVRALYKTASVLITLVKLISMMVWSFCSSFFQQMLFYVHSLSVPVRGSGETVNKTLFHRIVQKGTRVLHVYLLVGAEE